jgi:hypothetical protein
VAKGQVIETVAEEIAENLEEAAAATRGIDTKALGFFLGGIGVGVAIGFFFGHRWNKEQIKEEAFKQSEEEVEKIRQIYRSSAEGVRIVEDKPSLEDVVEERGYSTRVTDEEVDRPTRPPVVVKPATSSFPEHEQRIEKLKDDVWDWDIERAQRTHDRPYILHQTEFFEKERDEGYARLTYTYYAGDETLTDEAEEIVENPDTVVGTFNLDKFGHGADDVDVLYVRNQRLQMEFEICRTDESYQEAMERSVGNEQDGP